MPDDRLRQQIYEELGGLLTRETVDGLMSYLPPVGWADVATKTDLGGLQAELKGDMAKLEGRFDRLDGRFQGLEGRFEGLEGRFAGLEGRFEGLEGRFAGLEGRFEGLEDHLDAKIAEGMDTVRAWAFGIVVTVVVAMVGTIVAILLATR